MQFRTLDAERRDKRSVREKVCGQAVVRRHCNTMEMDKDKENITDIEKFSREGLVCSSDFLQSIDIEIVPNDKNKRRTFTTFEGNIWEASCTHWVHRKSWHWIEPSLESRCRHQLSVTSTFAKGSFTRTPMFDQHIGLDLPLARNCTQYIIRLYRSLDGRICKIFETFTASHTLKIQK